MHDNHSVVGDLWAHRYRHVQFIEWRVLAAFGVANKGEDFNSRPDQSASRWVINFFDWPLNRSAQGCWASATKEDRERWVETYSVPADYPDKVAADYPECLEIV